MKTGSTYKIVVDVNEKFLTFTGTIISEDEDFITFTDKFGTTLSYNKNKIVSFEEVR